VVGGCGGGGGGVSGGSGNIARHPGGTHNMDFRFAHDMAVVL